MYQSSLMSDSDVEKIHAAVVRTLDRVGMMFQNRKLLQALARAGAKVDLDAERAWIPPQLVEDTLAAARAQTSPDEAQPCERMLPPALPGVQGQVAQFYLDWPRRERRSGNREDFIRLIKLGDTLAGGQRVSHALLMTDVPPLIEPLEAVALLTEYAHNPGITYPHYAEQFDYLMEIGRILCDDPNRFLVGGVFITSPLRLCRRAADFMARRLEMGLDCNTSSMACLGASVPVTMAGALTVTVAEMIACWVAALSMRPEARLSGGIAAGSVDMRTGNVSYCSPEAMRLNFAVIELFRRLCGKRIHVAGASDYCDAKFPGLGAAFEKAAKVMTVAAFTGVQRPVGSGMLESGKTLCPEQLIIERELTAHIQALAPPLEVDADSLALDAIEEVGLGIDCSYLDCSHTLHHFRDCLWTPELLDRGVWKGFTAHEAEDRRILERASEMVAAHLKGYAKPDVDQAKLAAIRNVVDCARRDLARAD